MQDFRSLKVWERSHGVVLKVYEFTKSFPKEEMYHITNQLRRAATSVPTNIAEGCGRGSDADFKRFVQIAMASACEVEYLLLLSQELGYINNAVHDTIVADVTAVKKMLNSLMRTLKG